jgi:hypothetical protein
MGMGRRMERGGRMTGSERSVAYLAASAYGRRLSAQHLTSKPHQRPSDLDFKGGSPGLSPLTGSRRISSLVAASIHLRGTPCQST